MSAPKKLFGEKDKCVQTCKKIYEIFFLEGQDGFLTFSKIPAIEMCLDTFSNINCNSTHYMVYYPDCMDVKF